MDHATGVRERAEGSHRGTAALLGAWFEEHQELLRGLAAIRAFGPEADEAVQSVLKLRKIWTARVSWELWASFTRADGVDPETLLLQHVSGEMVRLGKLALFGSEPVRLSLVDSESAPASRRR